MSKQPGGGSPALVRFGVKVPPFVEHKKNKLSKCFFAREGAVVAQYEDTSALRLFRLTTSNEFEETKLYSALPPASLMAVQWPFVATVHTDGKGGEELLRIFDLGQEAFPQLTQAIPRTQDEITGLFVDQERVFLVKRDAIFHFYGFDFSIFGGDTKCFAVPMQPRLPFRPQHDQSMQRGRRALLIGGTKLVLIDLMTGRELVSSRALDMPVRDVDFNDDVVVATTHTSLYVVPCAGGEGARVAMNTTSTCVQLIAQQQLLMGHVDGTVSLWSVDAEPRRLRLFGTPQVPAPAGLSSLETIMAFAVRRLLPLPDEATFVSCTGTRDASVYSLHSEDGRALEIITLKEPFMNIALFGEAVHFLGTSSLSVWHVTAAAAPAPPLSHSPTDHLLSHHHPHAHTHSSGSSGDAEASATSVQGLAQTKRRGSSLALMFKRSNRDKEKYKEKDRKTRSEIAIERPTERTGRDWSVTQGAMSLADSSGDTRNTSSDKSSVDAFEEDQDEDDEDDDSRSADKVRRSTPPSSSSPPRRRLSAFTPGSHRVRTATTSSSSSPEKLRLGLVSTGSLGALPAARSPPLDVRRGRSRDTPSASNSADASGSGSSPGTASLSTAVPGPAVPLTLAARSSRRGQSSLKTVPNSKPSAKSGTEASTTSSGSEDFERQLQRAQETIRKQEETIARLRGLLARYEAALRDAGKAALVEQELEHDPDSPVLDATTLV